MGCNPSQKTTFGLNEIILMVDFYCHGCGLCCKTVGKALKQKHLVSEPWRSLLEDFPYKVNEDGSCEMLDETNQCMVYEDRPIICNVKKLKEVVSPNVPSDEYNKFRMEECKTIMHGYGYSNEEIKAIYSIVDDDAS